ncbi:MAG: hypothetical protein BWK76_24010 [Desulfobulbaceae bacterium A2]|nr:MAG: hypothetical protein BWK76_24010 [Desulfobulbaceae bacterium A2]
MAGTVRTPAQKLLTAPGVVPVFNGLMNSQKVSGWLSKKFDRQGAVVSRKLKAYMEYAEHFAIRPHCDAIIS